MTFLNGTFMSWLSGKEGRKKQRTKEKSLN
jgi:hypothetical protein